MTKLLYLSSGHPLQENCDVLMWQKLGIDWFSTGYYAKTNKPGDLTKIEKEHDPKVLELFTQQKKLTHNNDRWKGCGQKNNIWTKQHTYNLFHFTQEFIDQFDVILFSNHIQNLVNNWDVIKNKLVIFKTYAIHSIQDEKILKEYKQKYNIKIVRNSPMEHLKYGNVFAGQDAVIRGSVVKDENDISGWNGQKLQTITFCAGLSSKTGHCDRKREQHYNAVCKQLPKHTFITYGPCNTESYIFKGFISHENKVKEMQDSRVNLVVGTYCSNNTYGFVESWIMGMPTVVFGPTLWISPTYEIDRLVTNGTNGFYFNSYKELADIIQILMKDEKLAKQIGQEGRKKSISLFGREKLSKQWKQFFSDIT